MGRYIHRRVAINEFTGNECYIIGGQRCTVNNYHRDVFVYIPDSAEHVHSDDFPYCPDSAGVLHLKDGSETDLVCSGCGSEFVIDEE